MYTSALSKLGGVKLARHNRESRAFRKDPWPEFWPGFKPRPTREPSREIIPRRVGREGRGRLGERMQSLRSWSDR